LEICVKEIRMYKLDHLAKILLLVLVIGVWALLLRPIIQLPTTQAQSKSENPQSNNAAQILKARGLIIVDERGRERIFIGSPVPDPKEGRRRKPATGITINDPAGFERFAVGLFDDNRLIIGLDVPLLTDARRTRD